MNNSDKETINSNSLFCPHCNINFVTKGRYIIHYETQSHKNNLIKCKKPFNINKLEKFIN